MLLAMQQSTQQQWQGHPKLVAVCSHCLAAVMDLQHWALWGPLVLLYCRGVLRAPHIIQSQLSEVITTVVYCDYPQAWPGLLEGVMAHLTSNVSRY